MLWFISAIHSVAALASSPPDDWPRRVSPAIVLTGTDSAVAKRSFIRCTSKAEFHSLWKRHQAGDKNEYVRAYPEIDFSSHMVIAWFEGTMIFGSGFREIEVFERPGCLHVRFDSSANGQVIFTPTRGKGCEIRSYAFVVVPISRKEVVFEEKWRLVTTDPYSWKERARIQPVGK